MKNQIVGNRVKQLVQSKQTAGIERIQVSSPFPFFAKVWLPHSLFRWLDTWQKSFLAVFLWNICRKWTEKLDRNSLRYLMNNRELLPFKCLTRAE